MVWRAHDELLDRDVAVKILHEGGDERFRLLVRAEAKAVARLNNPRIAHIYDYGETPGALDDTPYLVMELVEGEPLSRLLADGAVIPWRRAAGICAEIADALRAAHSRGLVHRDIKPDNVILTAEGVKLIDFGISALIGTSETDEDGALLGTAAYTAPERLEDAPVGAEADVYALGVMLYRMLAGTLPWHVDSRAELLEAHLSIEPAALPPVEGMPSELSDLCATCIDKRPDRRPPAGELARVLSRITTEHAVAGLPPAFSISPAVPPAERIPALVAPVRGNRRARRRMAVVVAATGCAVLLSVAAWTHDGDADRTAADPVAAIPSPASCTAAFVISRDWGRGFTARLTVTNIGTGDIRDWRVSFTFPGDQQLSVSASAVSVPVEPGADVTYSAVVSQTGARVSASSTDSRQALHAHESVTVPISGRYHGTNPIPTTFSLNEHVCLTRVAGAATVPTAPGLATTVPPVTGPAAVPSGTSTSDGSTQPPTPPVTASTAPSPMPSPSPTPSPSDSPTPTPTPTPTPSHDHGHGPPTTSKGPKG